MNDPALERRAIERRPSRRRLIAATAAAATTLGLGGCLTIDAPVAEPEEGFADLILRVVNDGDVPVDAFVTVTSSDGANADGAPEPAGSDGDDEIVDEISIVGLSPGETAETRSVAYPRRPYVVHVPAGDQPTFRWNAETCVTFELELRFRNDDVESTAGCAREW